MTTNQSLSRGLSLLDIVNKNAEPVGVRELARMLEISPSIVQRLTNTLMEAGYLQQVAATKKYQLGVRALALGSNVVKSDLLYTTASAELRHLAEHYQLNGYLGVLQQNAVVYLHAVQSHGAIAIRAEAGQRIAAHATALGKALIAGLPLTSLQAILGPEPYQARTAQTITTMEGLMQEIKLVQRQGYSIADEENEPGIVSIGAPVHNKEGVVVAAISVAFLKAQRGPKEWPSIAELVLAASAKCSNSIGFENRNTGLSPFQFHN